jgi:hypothetical protein
VGRLTQTVKHKPSGFLSDPDLFGQLKGGYSLASSDEQVHGVKPFVEGDMRPLEDSPGSDREVFSAFVATIIAILARGYALLLGATDRAFNSIRPKARFEIGPRRGFVGKHLEKLKGADSNVIVHCMISGSTLEPLSVSGLPSSQTRTARSNGIVDIQLLRCLYFPLLDRRSAFLGRRKTDMVAILLSCVWQHELYLVCIRSWNTALDWLCDCAPLFVDAARPFSLIPYSRPLADRSPTPNSYRRLFPCNPGQQFKYFRAIGRFTLSRAESVEARTSKYAAMFCCFLGSVKPFSFVNCFHTVNTSNLSNVSQGSQVYILYYFSLGGNYA